MITQEITRRVVLANVASMLLMMLPAVVAVPCSAGDATSGQRAYWLVSTPLNWAAAEQNCAATYTPGGHLAVFTSPEEQERVAWAVYQRHGLDSISTGGHSGVWIGLGDHAQEGTFRWADGTAASWTTWTTNQPDNHGGGGEDCVHLRNGTSSGYGWNWNDFYCDRQILSICSAPCVDDSTTTPTATTAPVRGGSEICGAQPPLSETERLEEEVRILKSRLAGEKARTAKLRKTTESLSRGKDPADACRPCWDPPPPPECPTSNHTTVPPTPGLPTVAPTSSPSAAPTTLHDGWSVGLSKGSYGAVDPGAASFNDLFWDSSAKLVVRLCAGCAASHRVIYYKRLTNVCTFQPYEYLKSNWRSLNNVLHTDFELYSTYEDVVSGSNPWQRCNYDDYSVGFPRDCGPSSGVGRQWNSWMRSDTQATSVQFLVSPNTEPGSVSPCA